MATPTHCRFSHPPRSFAKRRHTRSPPRATDRRSFVETNAYAVLPDSQWRGYRPPEERPVRVATFPRSNRQTHDAYRFVEPLEGDL